MLVLFIIFLPKGIVGAMEDWWRNRKADSLTAK